MRYIKQRLLSSFRPQMLAGLAFLGLLAGSGHSLADPSFPLVGVDNGAIVNSAVVPQADDFWLETSSLTVTNSRHRSVISSKSFARNFHWNRS